MPSEPRKEAIAKRLALARKQAGLTQSQVAKMLGVHRPTISEMEAGRRRVSADELAQLSDIYGVSITWLVGDDESDPEDDRIELAARELSKLDPDDLDRVLSLLASLRQSK
jgi:transcriptional regulator with XRE-family HTH domain